MITIFEPILANTLVYIDDILLFSPDEQSHAKLLSKFYSIVTKYGIMLSEKKMEVEVTTIQFLDMEISDGKYQPQPHVAQELLKFPNELSSQKMIQQFLGQTEAVKAIKYLAKKMPPLKIPASAEKRILQTDASDECWGAIHVTYQVVSERLDADLQGTPTDQTTYRRMIGGLMYLTASQPDIAFATFVCARYQARPTVTSKRSNGSSGCKDDCKSTSGGVQFLGGKLVSWSSKKQDCTAMSTAGLNYVSLLHGCAQYWFYNGVEDIISFKTTGRLQPLDISFARYSPNAMTTTDTMGRISIILAFIIQLSFDSYQVYKDHLSQLARCDIHEEYFLIMKTSKTKLGCDTSWMITEDIQLHGDIDKQEIYVALIDENLAFERIERWWMRQEMLLMIVLIPWNDESNIPGTKIAQEL
ncbi:putative reverse transcriptase domain, viral movement protein [Tanacetum coccineum]|uniref:Reverse transcriptase domain, viral movement protein n=1 Tax=Tanacetum coccineum TaxID=301880 RepID=A0ABQ4X9N4_9ASTR